MDKATHKVDKKLLKRAIFNFIYNALVHNDENVVVKIQIDDIGPQSELHTRPLLPIMAAVFPDKDLEQVFERYYRGTNTASRHGTCLGMGIRCDIILAQLQEKLDLTKR